MLNNRLTDTTDHDPQAVKSLSASQYILPNLCNPKVSIRYSPSRVPVLSQMNPFQGF